MATGTESRSSNSSRSSSTGTGNGRSSGSKRSASGNGSNGSNTTTARKSSSGGTGSTGSTTKIRSTGSSGTSNNRSSSNRREDSAFSWGRDNGSSTGALIGAALAGAAIGFAANYGRKFLMQGMEAMAGDWDEILAAEHDTTLAIFDKMLATDESQTFKRKMLFMKLTHALDKHAHQEEMVVYPALREAGVRVEADQLEVEHGEVKTFLFELQKMGPDAPNWLEKVREFRSLISRHVHMEEEQVFPSFKQNLTEAQNADVTQRVNRDGFWMA